MYRILFLLFALLYSGLCISQNNEGEIVFEEKINIHRSLPPEMEGMKDNIPEFRSSKHLLLFNAGETLYKAKEKTEEEKAEEQEYRSSGHRRGMHMRFGRGRDAKSAVYTDLSKNITLSSTEFFGKQFLINGTVDTLEWKVSGKQKQVGSYLCMEAIHKDTAETVIVWFTPMIPVQAGPAGYTGLPGMILHVDINDGERMLTALNVQLKSLEEGAIVQPTEGKPITQEDFKVLREEKMEEMRNEYGGGRRYMISHD
jgi:GLPGLI family protein